MDSAVVLRAVAEHRRCRSIVRAGSSSTVTAVRRRGRVRRRESGEPQRLVVERRVPETGSTSGSKDRRKRADAPGGFAANCPRLPGLIRRIGPHGLTGACGSNCLLYF